jgi:Flp pilus assembly protein TadD
MDRSLARLAAALLLGTALSACSTLGIDSPAPKTQAAHQDASRPNPIKSLAADMDTQIRTAQSLRAAGDYQGATRILSQLMLIAPDSPSVVGEYGKTLVQQGRPKEALDFLKRAVELAPRDWTIYSAMGVANDQSGDYAEAKIAYQQALSINPGNAGVLNNYALSRMQAGDLTSARRLMAQAQAAGASDPKIASNVAMMGNLAPTPVAEAAPPPTAMPAAARPAPIQAAPLPPAAMPKTAVARANTAPRQTPPTIMMQQIPEDPKAGPVKVATGAPHKLVKERPVVAAAKAEPKKVAVAAPEPKKVAAAVPPKKVATAAATPPAAKKPVPAADKNKTPALRMTADAASP